MTAPKPISLRSVAMRLDIHPNYFAHLKSTNKVAFKYVTDMDESLFDGYNKYTKEQEDTKARLIDVYYLLSDLSLISQFSRYLHKKGYYSNWNGFSTTITGILFTVREGFFSHTVFIKSKLILDEFCLFYTETRKGVV